MTTENDRTLIDRLGKVSDARLAQLRGQASGALSPGGAVALKFKAGDRVVDLATGKRGEVQAAEPRAGAKGGLYAVRLEDGRGVFRGEDELALDQAVAPAPEK